MYRAATCLLLSLWLFAPATSAEPSKVYLFPTLHRLHRDNPEYSYDSLRAAILRCGADIIAVEVRPEDLHADTAYLRKNYPFEMWMMRYWFPGAKFAGFDWLGKDIAARPIPEGYWNETALIKKLERGMRADSFWSARIAVCDTALPRRMQLLKTLSLSQLMASDYGPLTEAFYECLEEKLRPSRFAGIPEFYRQRNAAIIRNCLGIIREHPGQSIVILTGADHYSYLKKALVSEGIQLTNDK